jgi:hypothetical protein
MAVNSQNIGAGNRAALGLLADTVDATEESVTSFVTT